MADATTRAVAVSAAKVLGVATVTFSGVQKITRVYDDTSGTRRYLTEKHWDELREKNPGTNNPTEWATQSADDDTVTILLNVLAQDTDVLKADGFLTTTDLSGSQVPAFPEDFHDILIEGVLADEYRKRERLDLAKISKAEYEARLSDLRMWFAKSLNKANQQGELATTRSSFLGGGSGGGSAPSGGTSYIQTGLVTFDRDPDAPFAVTASSAVVPNLDADKLDGLDSTAFIRANGSTPLTANWDAGSFEIRAETLESDIATGTAPLTVASTTVVTNLNADKVDGKDLGTSSDTQVIFNDGGTTLSGSSGLAFNNGTGELIVNGAIHGSKSAGDALVQLTVATVQDWTIGADFSDSSRLKIAPALSVGSGDLVIIAATGIEQLKFAATQSASSNANTLDDYEEGTWTPVISGSGGTAGQAYTTQAGLYVKVGQLVHATFNVELSTEGTITGNAQISGLPFAAHATYGGISAISWASLATNWVIIFAEVLSNASLASLVGAPAAAGSSYTNLAAADITDTTILRGTIIYRAAA